MLTRQDISKEYRVVGDTIASPGRFYLEPLSTVAAYDLALDGGPHDLVWPDGAVQDIIYIDAVFRVEFSVPDEVVAIVLHYCDCGFVVASEQTNDELAVLLEANNAEWNDVINQAIAGED